MSSAISERPRARRRFRLLGAVIATIAFAAGLSAVALQSESTPASAATVSFSQCNGHDLPATTGAPMSVFCSRHDRQQRSTPLAAARQSSTSRVCTIDGCTGDIVTGNVINAVHQCNGSNNVGGSPTVCSVNIVNNISIDSPAPATALTLNQCIGSVGNVGTNMTACIPSSQGGPTVTQCNGSGNGGGGAMICNASGTDEREFPVTVDQCNGSENGGGSTVTCTVDDDHQHHRYQCPGHRRSDGDGRAHAARADRCAGLRAHGGRRGDHQYRRGAIAELYDVKLSANWMAPAGHPGEDAALYDTVRAVRDLCVALGRRIPVGKDSMSMRTTWTRRRRDKRASRRRVSLVVSAFAPVADARAVLTPLLRRDAGDTRLVWIDIAAAGGGSAARRSRRSTASSANEAPDRRRSGAAAGVLRR